MPLPKLQYISDGKTFDEQYQNILAALDSGIKWIQLRWKNIDKTEVLKLAEKVKLICDHYNCILIINDYPDIARSVHATGVHLGLKDEVIEEARKKLFPHQWIGGTANTLNDVLQRIKEQVNYIGLGPFRFTTTKANISPVLGLKGYQNIISSLPGNAPPIFAIGGIQKEDIPALLQTGVYGIAVSSLINQSNNKSQLIEELNSLLYESFQNC